jgi:UDP-GlcNAc:undecaprenyl-phosphate GlcNAc-1-phosphate transferase
MPFAIAGLSVFILQLIFTPIILKISHKNQWYDLQAPRKIHTENIPRTGGIGIFIALSGTIAFFIIFDLISPIKNVSSIIIGISIIFLTGILDDFENIRARYKFILQIIAAIIVINAGFRFSSFPLPFDVTIHNRAVTYGVTLFWIVGVTNALNLIDGMDGLAGGISCIAALFWGVLSLSTGHTTTAIFAFTIAGTAAGFLVFNKPPAKIFMGDSGSLILGYGLAVLPLIENGEAIPTGKLFIAITLLVIPIFDTLSAIFRRIRLKKSIAEPDRDHIHHKLMKLNLGTEKILFLIYSFCVFSGLVALLWTLCPWLNVYFLPLTWIPALVLFRVLHRRYWHKIQSEKNRQHN